MLNKLFKENIKAIVKWLKQFWFEAKLKGRLDRIELENRIESQLQREAEQKPIYIEHAIDPELQTGESQKLGGAMELRAPWYKNEDESSETK